MEKPYVKKHLSLQLLAEKQPKSYVYFPSAFLSGKDADVGQIVVSAAAISYFHGISYSWYSYDVEGDYTNAVAISNANEKNASFIIPGDASGKNIHIILEIHDDGSPELYAYRRLIIHVA